MVWERKHGEDIQKENWGLKRKVSEMDRGWKDMFGKDSQVRCENNKGKRLN